MLLAAVMLTGCVCLSLAEEATPSDLMPDEEPATLTDLEDDGPTLRISEVCADASFVLTTGGADFIELYYAGTEPLDLSGYTLLVDGKVHALPSMTLSPRSYTVLLCDGKQLDTTLSRKGVTLALADPAGETLDEVTVPAMKHQSWWRGHGLSYVATPGYANTEAGELALYEASHGDLIVSEALSGNFRGTSVSKGYKRYTDAIEITNVSDRSIKLSHYTLSDDADDLGKYTLPDETLKPGESYKLYAATGVKDERCTGFKLSSNGEVLYLSKGGTTLIDVLNVPPLPLDVSYGVTDGLHRYYADPNLGRANTGGRARVAEMPTLSVTSGRYTESFTVTVTGEGPFYYTTDQSVPTAESERYTGPIEISKTTTLRVIACPEGAVPSKPVTAVYQFNKEKYSLPCVYITVSRSRLSKDSDSLFVNATEKGVEVPVYITYLNSDGSVRFELDAGLAISGQSSRKHKHRNFKVNFRSRYGGELKCQAFDDMDLDTFDSLLFRVGTNGNPFYDVLGAAVGRGEMDDVLSQDYQAVNLFVGTTYYGIYYMREHINEKFVADHLGGSEDHVDMIHTYNDVEAGSAKDYLALVEYCRKHDLKDEEHYQYVLSQIDVNSFIDYFIWRPFTGDTDTPNIRIVRCTDAEDPRWHLVIYDMDWAWQKSGVGFTNYTFIKYDNEEHNNIIIYALLKNHDFRKLFLQRASYLFENVFDKERVIGIIDTLNAELKPDLEKSQEAWNSSVSAWNSKIRAIKRYITGTKSSTSVERRVSLLAQIKKYLHLDTEDMALYFPSLYKKVK